MKAYTKTLRQQPKQYKLPPPLRKLLPSYLISVGSLGELLSIKSRHRSDRIRSAFDAPGENVSNDPLDPTADLGLLSTSRPSRRETKMVFLNHFQNKDVMRSPGTL